MGGERETFLESSKGDDDSGSKPASMGSVAAGSGSRIRIHESGGEVHFHDDTIKLKVAVPVSTWFKAWEKLSAQPQVWQYVDIKNKSMLTVETKLENCVQDATINILPLTVGTNFSELAKFTTRK